MNSPIRTVAFIGLGTMGAPMARNLLRAGFHLRAYDAKAAALAAIVRDGATEAMSPADAVRGVDCAITMLPDSPHVEEVLFGPSGIVEALERDAIYIDMSTIAPSATDRFGEAIRERGSEMVDAPVGRSSQHAVDGKLLVMVGATESALERVQPVLVPLGDTIVHCGPPGSGSRMKIVNNFMSITLNVTTAEALSLAEASGLDPELARTVMLGTVAGQGHMGTTYPAKVLKDDFAPGFAVDLAAKDLGLALDLAREVGIETATGTAALPAYERARASGRGRDDWTAIYDLARQTATASNKQRVPGSIV